MILAASMLLSMMGTGLASAAETADAPEAAASAPAAEPKLMDMPAGATVRTDEAYVAYFVASKASIPGDLTVFRPNPNMPEVTKQFLADQITKSPTTGMLGYMPRLVVHPCEGCSGSDYEKAVAKLVAGYESYSRASRSDGAVQYRGVMPVEVRWFGTKTLFVPLSQNQFGISFVYEGKLVSLGKSTTQTTVFSQAETMGERLAYEMLLRAGVGLRPRFLLALDNDSAMSQVNKGVGTINVGIKSLVGNSDTRSRIEPVDPVKHARLLPAVDGINPGEVRPISEMHLLPNL